MSPHRWVNRLTLCFDPRCIVSQLTFSLGGSIFKGGNGSMMIEAVVSRSRRELGIRRTLTEMLLLALLPHPRKHHSRHGRR